MRTLDDILFDYVFEPISHRVEYHTGVNNFALERYALAPWVTYFVWRAVSAMEVLQFVSAVIICVSAYGCMSQSLARENASVDGGLANPLRYFLPYRFLRYFWLVNCLMVPCLVFVGDVTAIPMSIAWWSFCAVLYFGACNRMPPRFRQEREARSGRLATVEN